MSIYDVNGNAISVPAAQSLEKIIITAHRGYYVNSFQNTIEAIIEANENGFECCEIDIHKCADGVYVLSHNSSVTLYNNGSSASVNLASANYSDIKTYTWDSAGKYRISTLSSALVEMKLRGMLMICDRKSGTNADIVKIASNVGALDCIMLYYSSTNALLDVDLLNRHPNIPLRIWASDYSELKTLMSSVKNKIYCDMTPANNNAYALANAFACDLPILFADCEASTANRWVPIAHGCMAKGSNNISYAQFYELMSFDANKPCEITANSSASVSVGSSITVTASSSLNEYAGFLFGYSLNPLVASTVQTGWGQNASVTVTGVSAGSTFLRFFTASGTVKDIALTVS